jgi:hypothetical protein
LVEHTAENRGVAGSIPALAIPSWAVLAPTFRRLPIVAGLAAAFLLTVGSTTAFAASEPTAEDIHTLDMPSPEWLTSELKAKIVAAGTKGLEVELRPNAAG